MWRIQFLTSSHAVSVKELGTAPSMCNSIMLKKTEILYKAGKIYAKFREVKREV
jgi:hypothetical protein